MKEAFEGLFESVLNNFQSNLEKYRANRLPDSTNPLSSKGGSSTSFSFHLDGNGNYHYETEQWGGGVTVHCCVSIDQPDATYAITVSSSDGGGGHWENVRPQQQCCCDIQTSLLHSTKLAADLHSNAANVDGSGTLEYSY
ncbi:MAG: hypothetical protein ABSD38_28750 [Syntrophorhabdales bacterium]|jgi:hypothetical protein